MGTWGYSEKAYQESKVTIPAGKHRVRISTVTPKTSKRGLDMYEITLDVSGFPARLFDYLVFMPDNEKMTNGKIGDICHSFGVSATALDPAAVPAGWVGAVGACAVKLDEESRSKVGYFIDKEKATDLPPWKEPERKQVDAYNPGPTPPPSVPPATVGNYMPPIPDEDLPWMN